MRYLVSYEVQVDEEVEKPQDPNPPEPFDSRVPEIPKGRNPFEPDQDAETQGRGK